jgi:sigma-54 specific flagellar transcriptional regulator A
VRELANLLERLAILFPEQTVTSADLPERYRNKGTEGWFGSGMRIVALAPDAEKLRGPSHALLEELLEAGETELSDTAELADMTNFVDVEDLVGRVQAENIEWPRGGIDLKVHMSEIEIGLIRKALEEADGTVAEAARLLGMRRTTLVEKLRKYRLSA